MNPLTSNFRTLDIALGATTIRRKPIDRKQRRISLGYTATASIDPAHNTFQISSPKPSTLRVIAK
jgi:hypothetical protein